ncbi:hypothetical protein F5Y19DRAFT_475351 [Xylariaceae sp. FL1651]|nr:hypothetical protein F5Y19DRAFT_475351 [Xylariaceae sp. FL1651]
MCFYGAKNDKTDEAIEEEITLGQANQQRCAIKADYPTLDNTEIKWNFLDGENEDQHYQKVFHEVLQDGPKTRSIFPSPPVEVEASGLEGLNAAMDKLKASASLAKIVVPP